MPHKAPLKIVKASAGSGKTFSLTVHYLSLLLAKESNYREILAVTFTNKATAEMKERILSVLQGLALGDQSRKIDDYRKLLLEEHPQLDSISLQEKARRIYRRILHDYAHFSVSTIDGFSQKVIRSFTYELNLDAGYAIEMNSNKVKRDLTIMLNNLLDEKPELLEWIINYAEQKIGNNENWNYRNQLMSLAGLIFSENFQEFDSYVLSADSDRIFNLLNQEVAEKTSTFLQALSEGIENFQQAFRGLSIQEADLSGKSRNKFIAASKVNSNIFKTSITDLDDKVFAKFEVLLAEPEKIFVDQQKDYRPEFLDAVLPALEAIMELKRIFPAFIAYQAVQNNLYFLRLLKEMSDLLSLWRKENSSQLISDAQVLLNKIGLDENSDPTFIWEKIGNRYNYFLFDEFQDTSRIQWKNYSPLLLNALANTQGKQHEHLIVGDVKQSIYRWRNGDWRILLQQVEQQVGDGFHLQGDALNEFIHHGNLQTNYRSLPNIIKLNNYLFEHIPSLLQEALNSKVLESLSGEMAEWWHNTGNDQMLVKAYQDSIQTIPPHLIGEGKPQGSIEISFLPVRDGRFRKNQVIEESVKNLCDKIGDWIGNCRYKANQIGILVRSNAQAKLMIQELMRYKNEQGMDFEVVSGDALTLVSNNAISLLIETFRALVYQSDKHVIHLANMSYLYQILQGNSDFTADAWLKFKQNRIDQLAEVLPIQLIEQWNSLQKMPLVHLTEKLIETYQLGTTSTHLPYLLAFKDMVTQFSSKGERGLIQFLEFWEEDGDKAVLPSNGKIDAIEVTTIHKSKGLAYDVVMIPFCSWNLDGMTNGDFWIDVQDTPFASLGKIPIKYTSGLGKSIFFQQYFEEMLFNYMDALNTFYVATTRAKEHLYISAPQFKNINSKDPEAAPNFEIKNEYISDLVYQVLDDEKAVFPLTDCQLDIQEVIVTERYETSENEGLKFALSNYPMSAELERALERSTKRSINNILMMEEAARYGVLAHEIISTAEKETDIAQLVDQYIEEGILVPEERTELMQEIHEIWHHPQIHTWLTSDYKVWNEASIITSEGKTLRPDKVFSKDGETIVLDFKFTKGDYIEHKYQVGTYMDALKHVGYKQIKGYLYYAKTKELVEVN